MPALNQGISRRETLEWLAQYGCVEREKNAIWAFFNPATLLCRDGIPQSTI